MSSRSKRSDEDEDEAEGENEAEGGADGAEATETSPLEPKPSVPGNRRSVANLR